MFYDGTIKYLLGIASPSMTMAYFRPKLSCFWMSKKGISRDQRMVRTRIFEDAQSRTEAFLIINELGGYER